MSTFCAVNDRVLIGLIEQARRRIVYVAPGLFLPVAEALCSRFAEIGDLDVTLVLDADEEVCRIGYGDLSALKEVHGQTQKHGFYVRSQPGLRLGVLLVDEQTLIWSPTARAIEAVPDGGGGSTQSDWTAPNGLLLGGNPNEQIAHALSAEGTETDPSQAEIGKEAITPAQVHVVAEALAGNPPIPVDLARITRVFGTKLQFVELKVTRSRLSQQQVRLPSLFNADAGTVLQELLHTRLRLFSEYRDVEVDVPMYARTGKLVFDAHGQPEMEPVTEASLERERNQLEREFLYDIAGFGRLMERARRTEFEARVNAFHARLLAHANGLKEAMLTGPDFIQEAIRVVIDRVRAAGAEPPDRDVLYQRLSVGLAGIEGAKPSLSLVFKDVTYEQTQSDSFRQKLDRALPPHVKRRLGAWFEQFTAARASSSSS